MLECGNLLQNKMKQADEYISKTKFQELMRKKSRNYFDLYYADKIREHYNKAVGYSLAADEAIDFPSSDVQPVTYWISIKEQIPEEDESVLICTFTGARYVATRFDNRFFVGATASFVEEDVTHWMPLPEPPKEGDVE